MPGWRASSSGSEKLGPARSMLSRLITVVSAMASSVRWAWRVAVTVTVGCSVSAATAATGKADATAMAAAERRMII